MITQKQMRHNLHNAWRNANPDFGRDWYKQSNSWLREIEAEYQIPLVNLATATAHLSPRVQWKKNQQMLLDVIENGNTRGLSANVAKAIASLESDNPLDSLKGPKVSAFGRNLMLDFQPVTIDVWAARIAIPSITKDRFSLTDYRAMANAYRTVARHYNIEPAILQSTLWVNHRGKAE